MTSCCTELADLRIAVVERLRGRLDQGWHVDGRKSGDESSCVIRRDHQVGGIPRDRLDVGLKPGQLGPRGARRIVGLVVAVDDQSDYPPTAPRTALSGFKPNVEAIAAKRPDLVVIADDSTGLSGALAKLGIPTIVDDPATTLDTAYAQITQLGQATGHAAQAGALVASMRSAIATVVASSPRRTQPVRIYHEVDQTFYSATSSTFIGQLYKLLGAQDIADAADSQGSGYPQLSAEYIVKADPAVIFLADGLCCGQTRATVSARPGWSAISAVKYGDVVTLNDDIASRWGPRVVDLVRAIEAGLMLAPSNGP